MFPNRGPTAAVAVAVVGFLAVLSCRRDLGPAPAHVCPPQATAAACSGGTGGAGGGGGGNTGGAVGGGAGGSPADAALPLDVARDTAPPPVDQAPPDMSPPCGKGGQACCPGNRCENGGCCIDDACVGPTEPCKIVPASCVAFVCGGLCGGINIACCPGSQCTAPGTFCGPNNVCAECGSAGKPCCMDNYCNMGLSCQAGTCMP